MALCRNATLATRQRNTPLGTDRSMTSSLIQHETEFTFLPHSHRNNKSVTTNRYNFSTLHRTQKYNAITEYRYRNKFCYKNSWFCLDSYKNRSLGVTESSRDCTCYCRRGEWPVCQVHHVPVRRRVDVPVDSARVYTLTCKNFWMLQCSNTTSVSMGGNYISGDLLSCTM